MENDYKKEAVRQYLRYFRFWFLAVVLLGAVWAAAAALAPGEKEIPRTNGAAPAERVYDYADVLTDAEEEKLRRHIGETEKKLGIDIVLVTIEYSVEGREAMERLNLRYQDWERNMRDIADDFWDENRFGYNKGFEGDGVLLLHNWYPGQNGEHLSTSGKVERAFDSRDIDRVLDAVDDYYDSDPYKAYTAYIDKVADLMEPSLPLIPWPVVLILPAAAALVYALGHLSQSGARNTTSVNTYVEGGKPEVRDQTDTFIRKSVVSRKIVTSSGGGGNGGGGGHHRSSGGASHGGGSHRH